MGVVGALSRQNLEFYETNGYLVLEEFASDDDCQSLMNRMAELVDCFDPSTISIFSTRNQKQHSNDYFYKSANDISFFFEEFAFNDDGQLRQPKALSINKVGHALHDLDPTFRRFSRSEKVASLAASLGYKVPLPIQSMYIFKQPGIGGEVVAHQDNTFLYTDPPSCTGLWFALEDADIKNGCLWVLPGSQKDGVARRMKRGEDGLTFDKEPFIYEISKFIPVEVKAGALVVLHGSLVHQSFTNTSSKSRHAYSLHIIEGDASASYLPDNWLEELLDGSNKEERLLRILARSKLLCISPSLGRKLIQAARIPFGHNYTGFGVPIQ